MPVAAMMHRAAPAVTLLIMEESSAAAVMIAIFVPPAPIQLHYCMIHKVKLEISNRNPQCPNRSDRLWFFLVFCNERISLFFSIIKKLVKVKSWHFSRIGLTSGVVRLKRLRASDLDQFPEWCKPGVLNSPQPPGWIWTAVLFTGLSPDCRVAHGLDPEDLEVVW